MYRRRTLVLRVFGAARWVLPWLCVLGLSATLAYATDVAITGGHLVPEASVATSAPDASDPSLDFCAAAASPMQYLGGNNWVRIAPRPPAGCVDNLPPTEPN